MEYFALGEGTSTIQAETTAPAAAEFEKTGIHIPSSRPKIDYDALESDQPRGPAIRSTFVKNVLLGLGVGRAVAVLALLAKWFIGN